MFVTLLHRIVAVPAIYNVAQFVAGGSLLRRKIAPIYEAYVPSNAKIIDVGGGTGLNLSYVTGPSEYTCVDNDPQKLEGFSARYPQHTALLADAATLPSDDGAFDVAFMSQVSHHLPDDVLSGAFREIQRVLKPEGTFIFTDALWEPRRWQSRFLWRVDRGSMPRPDAQLRAVAETYFVLHKEVRCAVHHRYVCWVLKPKK